MKQKQLSAVWGGAPPGLAREMALFVERADAAWRLRLAEEDAAEVIELRQNMQF